jgi:hypothetical protein
MNPEARYAIAQEMHDESLALHRRANALYLLMFPPWRWLAWWREYRAIKREFADLQRRRRMHQFLDVGSE